MISLGSTTPLPATRQESTTNARLYRCGPAAIDFRLSKTLARPSRDHPASHPQHRPTIAAKVGKSLAQAARKIKQWFRKLENHWRPWNVHQQLSNPFGNRYECINDFQNHLEKTLVFFSENICFLSDFTIERQTNPNCFPNPWRKRTPVSALMIARTKRQTPNLHQSMQQSTAGRKKQKTIVF